MIKFTDEAKEYFTKNRIEKVYLTLTYKKGPCSDNLCKLIPEVVVQLNPSEGESSSLISDEFINVFAIPPIAKSYNTHRNEPVISLTKVRKRLKIEGLAYTF